MTRFFPFRRLMCAALSGAMLVVGCATYHPVPLPTAPDLAAEPALTVPAGEFQLPGLKPHPFSKDGLDESAVVTLAVCDNPDLKAARLQGGVADAQLLQAGLLPDPGLGAGFASSALNYGYDAALSEDIQALITRGAARAAAKAHRSQVNLDILWQEWQVAEKARELFIQARADDRLQRVLTADRALLAGRYHQDDRAMQQHDLTLSTVSADLVALVDAETNLRQLELSAGQTRNALNQLLGLKPGVQLHLIGPDNAQPLSAQEFATAVVALPHRRADLLALRAGYQSQEQIFRQAILAQFPALSAGLDKARDSAEGVNSFGPSISVALPIFDHNQGQIALQRATRAVLRQTYQARLDQAAGDAGQVWQASRLMQSRLQEIEARLPALESAAREAEQSLRQRNLDAGLYVSVESSLLAEQAEAIRLRASLAAAQSALRTLLGLPSGAP